MSDLDPIRVVIEGAAEDLKMAARSAVREIRDVGQEVRKQNAETRAAEVQNLRTADSYRRLGDESRGAAQGVRNFSTSLRAVAWTAAIANTAPLAAGIADIGGAAVGAAAAVAPLAGTVATLPGLFAAGAQGLGVFQLATNGVTDALGGNQKAFDKLTPAAQQFVRTLRSELAPEIKKLQTTAQEGLFPGLLAGLKGAEPALKPLQGIVSATAKELGSLAEQAGKTLGSKQWTSDLETLGRRNVTVIDRMGKGAGSLADALRNITISAGPLLGSLTKLGDEIAANVDHWTAHARGNGDLASFFDLTRQRVQQTVDVVGNLGHTLFNVLGAAMPLGGSMMAGLVAGTQKLDQLTSSMSGKRALAKFFEETKAPLEAVAHLAGDLGLALADLAGKGQAPLTQLANTLDKDVLPFLHDALSAIATDLLPHVITLLGSVGRLLSALLPGLEPILHLAGQILDGVSAVVDELTKLTDGLPGVANLIPTLAVSAAVFGSWKLLLLTVEKIREAIKASIAYEALMGPAGAAGGAAGGIGGALAGAAGGAAAGRVASRAAAKAATTAASAEAVRLAVQGGAPEKTLLERLAAAGGLKGLLSGGARSLIASAPARALGVAGLGITIGQGARGLANTKGDFGLPTTGGGFASFVRDMEHWSLQQPKWETETRKFGDEVSRLKGRLNELSATKLSEMANQADNLAGHMPKAADALDKFASTARSALEQRAIPAFQVTAGAAGKHLSDIRTAVKAAMDDITRELGPGTHEASAALAKNFEIAEAAIKKSMQAGMISTKTGTEEIHKLMVKALEAYGLKPQQANAMVDHGTLQPLSQRTPGQASAPTAATGAYVIGRPGDKGRDEIPININGQQIMTGSGEVATILNHDQQQMVNGALQDRGINGLPDLFRKVTRPHYMASGGAVGDLAPVKVRGDLGTVSDVSQKAVDLYHDALAGLLGNQAGGAPSGGKAAPSGVVKEWLSKALKLTNHFSLDNLSALFARTMQESGGNPKAINLWDSNAKAGHPSKGLLQTIDSTFASYMMSGHGDIWDPVDNAVAAIRYMFARYGHVVGASSSGYARGGIVKAASGFIDTALGITQPMTGGKKGGKGRAKGKAVPFTGGSRRPNVSNAHGKIRPQKGTPLDTAAWLQDMMLPGDFDAVAALQPFLPDTNSLEDQITLLQDQLTVFQGDKGLALSNEQDIVTLYDSAQFPDAATWGVKDGTDVVNRRPDTGTGYTVQGAFTPGIGERIGLDLQELGFHRGQDGQGGILGFMRRIMSGLIGQTAPRIAQQLGARQEALAQLKAAWEHSHQLAELEQHQIQKLSGGSGNWQQRVADNQKRIDVTRTWMRKQRLMEVNHRPTAELKKKMAEAQSDVSRWEQENGDLNREKPVPKRGSKADQREAASRLRRLVPERDRHVKDMQDIAGDQQAWNPRGGVAGDYTKTIDGLTAALKQTGDDVNQLVRTRIPGEELEVRRLLADIDSANLTHVPLPDIHQGAGVDQAALNALLQQQLQDAMRDKANLSAQFDVFKGFQPDIEARFVGSFARGTMRVPFDGLAMVHQDETILPAPDGPFGNQLTAARGASGAAPVIQLTFADNSGQLVRLIDARVDGRAAKVVSETLGRRARLIASAPGGGL